MSVGRNVENAAIAAVAEQYRSRGYEVEIQPADVPELLAPYRPDLIARRQGETLVIEVKERSSASIAEQYADLAQRVQTVPGWRFVVVMVDPHSGVPDTASSLSLDEIKDRLAKAESLVREDNDEGGFLLAWSGLEAAFRALARHHAIPLDTVTGSALARELYSFGEISRADYQTVLDLWNTRNRVVHGFKTPAVGSAAVSSIGLARSIVGEILDGKQDNTSE